MDSLPPYARYLRIARRRDDDGCLIFAMPFSDRVLGRPGYLHGGAIAALLECAAFGALGESLGGHDGVEGKPINVTVQFMRGATARTTHATAAVTRLGKRIANIEAHAWQDDRARPVASAQMNVRLRRN